MPSWCPGPRNRPAGRRPNEHAREAQLTGGNGRAVHWQTWLLSSPRAVVVIAHGAGEHSGRYGHVAVRLVGDGYAVYAVDHQGHGRSQGPRALISRLRGAVSDLDSLITIATQAHPGSDIFLLGHSMGATIALRYAIEHRGRLGGLILSGPLAEVEAAAAPVRLLGGSCPSPPLGFRSSQSTQPR